MAACIKEDCTMLRLDTQNLSIAKRARLLVKYAMYPGTNWVSREKSHVVRMFLQGTADKPIRTLDCGCGNAYFSYHAVKRASRCTGITIHEWEKRNCEEMRSFLEISPGDLEFRVTNLAALADDPNERETYDQVLLLDVIEHISDAGAALRQIHTLLADHGLVYITTPNRDWQGNANRIRVTRHEDGWHVRNGYTFEQLESLLEDNGFEPVDRLRYGSVGSTLVTRIQHGIFGRWIDPMTIVFFPVLKLISMLLSPFPDPHTIFVLARRKGL
jgi:2-polyprenyl-3-methyl-5-hydroxy-6-metoxy-1,4-benzoquinol methylase